MTTATRITGVQQVVQALGQPKVEADVEEVERVVDGVGYDVVEEGHDGCSDQEQGGNEQQPPGGAEDAAFEAPVDLTVRKQPNHIDEADRGGYTQHLGEEIEQGQGAGSS